MYSGPAWGAGTLAWGTREKRRQMLQNKTLDELRAKIDQVDDAMHDLLMYRADVTLAIGGAKQGTANGALAPAMRPAREAQILRRLLARHKGPLPPRVIVRV